MTDHPLETVIWVGKPAPDPATRPWYWWAQNDEGIDPKYHPEWSERKRWFYWTFLRNPLWNFQKYVIGYEDQTFQVTGPAPVTTTESMEAYGEPGWKNAVITLSDGRKKPFYCYSSKNLLYYRGWMPSGGRCCFKLNPLFIARIWNHVRYAIRP